jgi:hypothetical protein
MSKKPEIEILLQDLDETDLGSMLRTYNEINTIKQHIENEIESLRTKIKIGLKERKWSTFMDDKSKISVSISTQKRESVNKTALKMLLNEEQYNQIITTTSFEKMLIVTPKDRERLKRFVNK